MGCGTSGRLLSMESKRVKNDGEQGECIVVANRHSPANGCVPQSESLFHEAFALLRPCSAIWMM